MMSPLNTQHRITNKVFALLCQHHHTQEREREVVSCSTHAAISSVTPAACTASRRWCPPHWVSSGGHYWPSARAVQEHRHESCPQQQRLGPHKQAIPCQRYSGGTHMYACMYMHVTQASVEQQTSKDDPLCTVRELEHARCNKHVRSEGANWEPLSESA